MIDGSVLQSAQRCFEKKSRVVVKMVVMSIKRNGIHKSLMCITVPIQVSSYQKKIKGHWDQNFRVLYFYIFEKTWWFLVTMPNFNSLRRLDVAFSGRFLSRFYGRHDWPLFRKLAWELAKATLKGHLKPSIFTRESIFSSRVKGRGFHVEGRG